MKIALTALAAAAIIAISLFGGGTFAAAQEAQQNSRLSPEDRAAFLDAHIAGFKAALELNADQEKNWPALGTAIREVAEEHSEYFAQSQEHKDTQDANPIDGLTRDSKHFSVRAAELEKLAAAAKPLYDSLDDSQKHRFAMLFRVGGDPRWGHGWGYQEFEVDD
jgi:hypothetical protein